MNKIVKKMIAVVSATALLGGLLTACGNNTGSSASDKEEETVIAYHGLDVGRIDDIIFGNSARALCGLANAKVVFTPDKTFDNDSCLSFVESQIAAGAQGLVFFPPSDAVLLTVMNLCEEAEVYWGISGRQISDETIREKVEASKYYVGNSFCDEYKVGTELMNYMHEFGYKKIAMISTIKGNTACDAREESVRAACEEYGMEIVAEARNFVQSSEIMAATQSFLAAHDDLDVVFILGTNAGGAIPAAVKAVQEAGRDDSVKVTGVDWGMTEGMADCFNTGVLTLEATSMQMDAYCVMAKVLNAVKGTPVSDTNFTTELKMEYFTEEEVAAKWQETFGDKNTVYMSDDEAKQLLKMYNEDLNVESFNQVVQSWNPVD